MEPESYSQRVTLYSNPEYCSNYYENVTFGEYNNLSFIVYNLIL